MISTVTTSTVSTVTAVTIAGSLIVIGIVLLLVLLVQKELASSMVNEKANRYAMALNIGIAPLLVAFVVVLVFKVSQVFH